MWYRPEQARRAVGRAAASAADCALLSHPAIVAREYGIPGVVGTRDATEWIADGMRVRVDGDAGEVTVLQ